MWEESKLIGVKSAFQRVHHNHYCQHPSWFLPLSVGLNTVCRVYGVSCLTDSRNSRKIDVHSQIKIIFFINLSFISGTYPCFLKIAKVIPIFKKRKHIDVQNYHPTSMLPVFSKVFERLTQCVLFLKQKTIYYQLTNTGSEEIKSTIDADLRLVYTIVKCIESKKYNKCDFTYQNILEHYGILGTQMV